MKRAFKILGLATALLLLCTPALAQCAMCRVAVTSATNGAAMMKSLNLASLVLLVPPVGIFCVIFGIALKRKHPREDEGMETEEGRAADERGWTRI
jgi:hypothetical protein